MEYYGARRKRDIDLSRFQQEEQSASIAWENEVELEEGYEEIEEDVEYAEEINEHDGPSEDDVIMNNEANGHFILDGRPFVLKPQTKKQTFSETHVRTTTYLEKNIHQIVRMLQQQNQIESITKFINDSIKHYLTTKYSE